MHVFNASKVERHLHITAFIAPSLLFHHPNWAEALEKTWPVTPLPWHAMNDLHLSDSHSAEVIGLGSRKTSEEKAARLQVAGKAAAAGVEP